MNDTFLYGYLPYVAFLAFGVGLSRLIQSRRAGPPPAPRQWDTGSRLVLAGAALVALNHLPGWVLPGAMRAFNADPSRLFLFEAVSLVGGLMLALGLAQVVMRRLREGLGSWVAAAHFGALLLAVLSGLHVAVTLRWGSAWGLHVVGPYLRSLVTLHPDTELLAQAPLVVRVHAMAAFVSLALTPFARMQAARAAAVRPVQSDGAPALASTRQETAP